MPCLGKRKWRMKRWPMRARILPLTRSRCARSPKPRGTAIWSKRFESKRRPEPPLEHPLNRRPAPAAAPAHPPARGAAAGLGRVVQLHLRFFGVGALRRRDVVAGARAPDIELMRALGVEVALTVRGEIAGGRNARRREQHAPECRRQYALRRHTLQPHTIILVGRKVT